MKKLIISILILMLFTVSCGGSKKAENDADILPDEDVTNVDENQEDEDIVESGDADETTTDEDAKTDEEQESKDDSGEAEEVKTRTAECTGLPENAQWNTVASITQTWNGVKWEPDTAGFFDEEPATEECRFKCADNYFRMIWEIFYNQEREKCVPECGKASEPVCAYPETKMFYDKDSGTLWSSLTPESVYIKENITRWESAVDYCENLVEGGYDDWHLPNIDELRSLVKNCPGTETGGACNISEINGELSDMNIKDECQGCTADEDYTGKYSKLGDRQFSLWSSSVVNKTASSSIRFIWGFNFYTANPSISNESFGGGFYVRCARKEE